MSVAGLGPQAKPEVCPSNPPASASREATTENPAASRAISSAWLLESVELGYTTITRKLRFILIHVTSVPDDSIHTLPISNPIPRRNPRNKECTEVVTGSLPA